MASNQQQQQQQQASRNGSRNGTPTIIRNGTPTTARRSHSRSNSIIDDSLPIPSIDSFTVASPIALNKTLGIPFLKNKNINNRSNSASKAATQKIYETEASNRSTSAYRARSRRKERRLENDNMFGIGGNHDLFVELLGSHEMKSLLPSATYLENEKFQIGNLTCYATPLSSGKSSNKAFQSKEFKKKTLESTPDKVDLLITHGHCAEIEAIVDHKVHIWGHAHNAYGIRFPGEYLRNEPIQSLSICAPIMDRHYNLSHLPIILDVPNYSNDFPKLPTHLKVNHIKRTDSILTRIKMKIFRSNNNKIVPNN
jgi:hypothetical protein